MLFDAYFNNVEEIDIDFSEEDEVLEMSELQERTDLFPVRSVDGVFADPAGNIDLSEARDRLISERVTQTFDERKDELIGPRGPTGPNGKDAYQYALDGGYSGTEEEFYKLIALDAEYVLWVGTVDDYNALTPEEMFAEKVIHFIIEEE